MLLKILSSSVGTKVHKLLAIVRHQRAICSYHNSTTPSVRPSVPPFVRHSVRQSHGWIGKNAKVRNLVLHNFHDTVFPSL